VGAQDGQALIVTRATSTAGLRCRGLTDPTIGAGDDAGRLQDPVLQIVACRAGGPTKLHDDLHDHTRIPSDTDDLGLVTTAKAAAGSIGTIQAGQRGLDVGAGLYRHITQPRQRRPAKRSPTR
jgi:hypothetical protein